tara:strand:+ start:824 stop:1606 length:783 start_codon:yes stop_codon:yes gene_type:complete
MEFLSKEEIIYSKKFSQNGYIISKIEQRRSLNYIKDLIVKYSNLILNKKNINLNKIHNYVSSKQLNEFRLNIINKINKDKKIRYHYFNTARKSLYTLAGNELMMQKNINLSIQFPNDDSSLLPIHSDVWSGDSPYEINLWIPLVDCYKTKSMYILENKYMNRFNYDIKNQQITNSKQIFNLVKKKIKWLKVNYGQCLIFNQALPHGNIVNKENETRWSMNCRFKSLFSPYGDKKIGEFFVPITTRPMTDIGLNFKYPFKK